MQLDSRTITLVGMATAMLVSMLGIMVARGSHTCPGFNYWTLANLCASFSLLLIGLKRNYPGRLSHRRRKSTGHRRPVPSSSKEPGGFEAKRAFWWPSPGGGRGYAAAI